MRYAIMALILLTSSSAYAQYRNYEVQPNGTGGYSGQYGNQNFEVTPEPGSTGVIYGRRPGAFQRRIIRAPRRPNAATQNCVVDSNGNAICR